MEIDFDVEFKEFMWQIGNFLRDRGYDYTPGVFCAATVAAWSLQHEQSEMASLMKAFKREETKAAIMEYAEFYKELQVISAQYGKEIIEYGMKRLNDDSNYNNRRMGPYFEHYGYMNDLLLGLHHLDKSDVYVEYGCGSGNGLLKAAGEGVSAYGVEVNLNAVIIADIKAYWNNMNLRIELADMDDDSVCNVKMTKSTVDTAFLKNGDNYNALLENKYLQPYKSVLKKAGVRTWSQALIAYQKNKDGRVIALTTPAALFNNADKELRKTLVNQGIIEGIIALPAGTLLTTSMAPVIIILSKNNRDGIKMMDATDSCQKRGKEIFIEPLQIEEIIKMYDSGTGKCKIVSTTEIMQSDYILSVNHYTEDGIENGLVLKDICDIERGATIKTEELAQLASETPTKYQYLMLQDIVDGKIENQLPYITGIDKKYKDAILRNNDIVISKLTPFKICLVHIDDDKEILANGNLFRLTVDPKKMNPVYVMLFLSSTEGQQELSKYIKGAGMRTISIKDLYKVQIPDIDRTKQDKIAAKYTTLMNRLKEIDLERQKVLSDISALVE
ncbi:N-6 DNA methylase [uncultured Anaerovibrio sp.]|uniref:N-6 DNA methylase n=1 Tax=uncultured Anaerovibrio sp. TaxID=361586 RepID=UPI00260EFB21|nr:N-6 DNA methylase [uncultured Anaerovibrio sp.]